MGNNTFYAPNDYRNYLEHHGIKGMKWGVRRFQNADGSYTSAGKGRYGIGDGQSYTGVKSTRGIGEKIKNAAGNAGRKISGADLTPEQKAARNAKIKKVALAVAGTAAVAAGTYAAHKYYKSTMAEAMSMMNDARKHAVDSYVDKIGEAYDRQRFTSKMVDSFERAGQLNTPPGQSWLAADQANRKAVNDIVEQHRKYEKRSASNIANRFYQHKAQREVVARDISNLKDNALGRLRGSDKASINTRRENNQKTAERYIKRIVDRGDAGRYLRKKSKP